MGDDLKKYLSSAYDLLSNIPVAGNMVEVMAEARQMLRNAYKIADESEIKPAHVKGEAKNG